MGRDKIAGTVHRGEEMEGKISLGGKWLKEQF